MFENCSLTETKGADTATSYFEKTLVDDVPWDGGGDGSGAGSIPLPDDAVYTYRYSQVYERGSTMWRENGTITYAVSPGPAGGTRYVLYSSDLRYWKLKCSPTGETRKCSLNTTVDAATRLMTSVTAGECNEYEPGNSYWDFQLPDVANHTATIQRRHEWSYVVEGAVYGRAEYRLMDAGTWVEANGTTVHCAAYGNTLQTWQEA
ncbi:MAG: hypothetical protein ACTSU5_08165 [Promethearchaeota archaeon]